MSSESPSAPDNPPPSTPPPRAKPAAEPLRVGARGAGAERARASEPAAVILASDLVRWIVPRVGKFPRAVRYGLGARIEAAHLDVLEELVSAQYARGAQRQLALARANLRLQVARHLVRVAREMNLIADNAATYAARVHFDLGNQVGSWRKASDATGSSSNASVSPST